MSIDTTECFKSNLLSCDISYGYMCKHILDILEAEQKVFLCIIQFILDTKINKLYYKIDDYT